MGKFSFDKDFAKRVSMHRDPEQHKKRGDNLNARKKTDLQPKQNDGRKSKDGSRRRKQSSSKCRAGFKRQGNRRRTEPADRRLPRHQRRKRRRRTPRFCRAAPSEPAGGNGGFQNRQERYCADGFQRRRGKADG